jgi:hypothetical protein
VNLYRVTTRAARAVITFVVTMIVLVVVGGGIVVAFGGNVGPTLLVLFAVASVAVTVILTRSGELR